MTTNLQNGYYAMPDPAAPDTMTYWRVRNGAVTPWPAKAWYGPARLLRRDAPADADARIAWLRLWQAGYREWLQSVLEVLEHDAAAARRRFAELSTRCCLCGRPLTGDLTKLLGVGSDCSRGLSEEMLAQLVTPAIAAAHAARLAEGA